MGVSGNLIMWLVLPILTVLAVTLLLLRASASAVPAGKRFRWTRSASTGMPSSRNARTARTSTTAAWSPRRRLARVLSFFLVATRTSVSGARRILVTLLLSVATAIAGTASRLTTLSRCGLLRMVVALSAAVRWFVQAVLAPVSTSTTITRRSASVRSCVPAATWASVPSSIVPNDSERRPPTWRLTSVLRTLERTAA